MKAVSESYGSYSGSGSKVASTAVPWTNALMGGGFRLGRGAMLDALRASLERLQSPSVDLYQVLIPSVTVTAQFLDSHAAALGGIPFNAPYFCAIYREQTNASSTEFEDYVCEPAHCAKAYESPNVCAC